LLGSARAGALRALRAIGYDEAIALLEDRLDRVAAESRTSLRTIQFAKRQRTWFRNRGRGREVRAEEAVAAILQTARRH
jgi:tRNA dimethylallyltransferase